MKCELSVYYSIFKTKKELRNFDGDYSNVKSLIINDNDSSIERIRKIFDLMEQELEVESNKYKFGYGSSPKIIVVNGVKYDFDRIEYCLDFSSESDGITNLSEAIFNFEANHKIKLWEKEM